MFAVKVAQDDFIQNPYFNISFFAKHEVFSGETRIEENITEIMLEPCTINHWINLPSYNISWTEVFHR